MKRNLPITFLLFLILYSGATVQAQPDQFAYAVTALNKDGKEWITLRKMNTQTGEFSAVLLDGSDKTIPLYDAVTKRPATNFVRDEKTHVDPSLAFAGSVAAIAYDKVNNRLYYVPLFIDQLRYIDLATMKVFCVTGQSFGEAGNIVLQPFNPISRMVISPDGYGYTLTNDGNHLFRFTTSGSPVITDLGEVTDNATNKETIHNACGNPGGDLVADDNGSLYLISSSNKVFKIDVPSKMNTFVGTISGLPQQFMTSGAAVDDAGKLVLSSSVYTDACFTVDPKSWMAVPRATSYAVFGSADLANSNVISTNPYLSKVPSGVVNTVKAYPNPVTADEFSIQFSQVKPGRYTVQLADAVGNAVLTQKIKIVKALQTETMHISGYNAQGFYFLKVLDENNKTVNTQILAVER